MAEVGLSEWREKAWGRTRTILRDDRIEITECEIVAGGYSSEHYHRHKHNKFIVISGRLMLRRSAGRIGWILLPGYSDNFPAGYHHQFEALEPTRLIEIYRPAGAEPIDPDDIVRLSEGGVKG